VYLFPTTGSCEASTSAYRIARCVSADISKVAALW
jgi:hypothetical protein